MRRLRYICGGEDGSEAKGSDGCAAGEVITPEDGTTGRALSSAGAPLTSWSNLASDMVVEDHKMVGQDYLLVSAILWHCSWQKSGCVAMPGITLLLITLE